MIQAIFVPVNPAEPTRLEQLDPADGDAYRDLVGGHFQVVELHRPRANLYLHEEGKLVGLPVNPRATALVWLHNHRLRGRDVIAGPALVLGRPDNDGVDTSVPEELAELLLGPGLYRVEVQVMGDGAWYGNGLLFIDWFTASIYAIDLAYRWTDVVDMRVVAATGTTDQRGRG
jgi:hypothetical protein